MGCERVSARARASAGLRSHEILEGRSSLCFERTPLCRSVPPSLRAFGFVRRRETERPREETEGGPASLLLLHILLFSSLALLSMLARLRLVSRAARLRGCVQHMSTFATCSLAEDRGVLQVRCVREARVACCRV